MMRPSDGMARPLVASVLVITDICAGQDNINWYHELLGPRGNKRCSLQQASPMRWPWLMSSVVGTFWSPLFLIEHWCNAMPWYNALGISQWYDEVMEVDIYHQCTYVLRVRYSIPLYRSVWASLDHRCCIGVIWWIGTQLLSETLCTLATKQ